MRVKSQLSFICELFRLSWTKRIILTVDTIQFILLFRQAIYLKRQTQELINMHAHTAIC